MFLPQGFKKIKGLFMYVLPFLYSIYSFLQKIKKVINENTRKVMKEMLKDIQTGKFAKEWIDENKKGRPNFTKMREEGANHPIEKIGVTLRKMMPWMEE